MPEEDIAWLRNYKLNNQGPYSQKMSDEVTYLPVKVHIVGTNNGANYYKIGSLLDAFCTLNNQFAPYGWQFYIYQDINYINNDNLYYHRNSYNGTINSNSVQSVINMFFVGFDPTGYNVCGYYSRGNGPQNISGNGRQGVVVIGNGCAGNGNSTIAHELGHFFSLPHTFFGWEGRSATAAPRITDERVSGSNCNTSGDFFCDTPADYLSDRWSCPYAPRSKNDFEGTPYAPDGALYMSYANDACQNYFSEEQLDAMRAYLTSERPYLLSANYPGYAVITDSAAPSYPDSAATGIPSNYVNLKWRRVPGADYYHLQVTRSLNPNNMQVDTVIASDTSILLTNLDPGFTYRWRVRAFNKYSTCSGYSTFRPLTTVGPTNLTPIIDIESISCNGAFDGSISLDVTGGTGPYVYTWANGISTSILTFLDKGNYMVTITDNNNESLALCIDVAEPDPLVVDIVPNGNTLIAEVTGGTLPYTFAWSTGETSAGIVAQPSNSYTVVITDKNGCTVSKTYNALVGINQVDALGSIRVYPNPTLGASSFTVEFAAPQAVNATIEVLDNAGRRVYQTQKHFVSGTNTTQVPANELSPGLYFVRVTGQNVVQTTKLLVY